jgi:hypothetical protein
MTTTEQKPIRVMLIGAGGNAAAIVAILEAARAIEVVPLVVEPEPAPLRLPILRDPEPIGPWWEPSTGKKKAQWKQETYGRKLK